MNAALSLGFFAAICRLATYKKITALAPEDPAATELGLRLSTARARASGEWDQAGTTVTFTNVGALNHTATGFPRHE